MTLREQLMLKRTLRRLRTWAPPISMGVIIGAGAFLILERSEPVREQAPAAIEYAAQPRQGPRSARAPVAKPSEARRAAQPSRAYSDCDAARAAGAAPIYQGQPGYGAHLDGDSDGIACEPHRR